MYRYIDSKQRLYELLDDYVSVRDNLINSPNYGSEGKSSNVRTDRLEAKTEKLIRLEELISRQCQATQKALQEVEELIECAYYPEGRLILRHRYIAGIPWKQISKDTGFDLSTCYRKHGKALKQIRDQGYEIETKNQKRRLA